MRVWGIHLPDGGNERVVRRFSTKRRKAPVNPEQYIKIMRPRPEFRDKALESVKEFIRECVKHVPQTVVTGVELPGVDLSGVKEVAEAAGAVFRARPELED